mmetsp:Transcript_16878/g.59000  ORF Transcript_16878/g.59000 Transcript_16878/m.59000 type:complete len:271 (+) Transcript_16878:1451-2263(+)
MISACEFMTKGPCCTTGSSIGLPCSMSSSAGSEPSLVSTASAVGRILRLAWPLNLRSPTRSVVPLMKKSDRLMPATVGGSVQLAPGSIVIVHTATWLSGSAAHESGGGDCGTRSPSLPATARTTVFLLASSAEGNVSTTVFSLHIMRKCGLTNLDLAGRLSQIWKRSRSLGLSVWICGNISQCDSPAPAVIHCVSPSEYRPAQPRLSEWSTVPLRTSVIVSKPRCGCSGKPGVFFPWYMFHAPGPVRPKSIPSLRPWSGAPIVISGLPGG